MNDSGDRYITTAEVIDKALDKGIKTGIKDFVFASCTGKTAEIFLQRIFATKNKSIYKRENKNTINLVCVTHQVGFFEANKDEMPKALRTELTNQGVNLLTATHLFAGVDRALRFQFQGVYPAEIVAATLRMFGQGLKVCVEISVMAVDAGLIKSGEDIIAVGGTGSGADTAVIINPSHSQHIFKTKIKEIICKPFEF